jgi:hypothetical protein
MLSVSLAIYGVIFRDYHDMVQASEFPGIAGASVAFPGHPLGSGLKATAAKVSTLI